MKKRFFALLLMTAILASMVVAPTYAVETGVENTTPLTDTCPCGCGEKLESVTWKVWDGDPNSGHYYLDGDFTQPEELNIISGNSVVLDLRGYTLTSTAKERLFTVNGYLGILDSVGGGRLTSRTAGTYNGGIIRIADNETAGSLVELYSGTITPRSDATRSKGGGLIGLGDGATFRMYGGLLLGGNATGAGGAIHAESSTTTVEILGGSIVGNQSTGSGGSVYSNGGVVTLKNCAVIGGSGSNGGNIYISGGSLTIDNCIIANGISETTNKYGGGNICNVSNSKINITNSKIYGGYALSNGGNLSVGYGTTTIKNTQIYGGTCEGMGANISLPISSASLTLDGCTVDGGMDNIMGKLTLKGATKINLTNGGLDLGEQGSKTTTATGLTAGAEVYVSGNKTLTGKLDYIKPALNCTLTASGTTLTVAPAADGVTAGYCPHCNEKVAWQPYGTANATHTYLSADMTDFAEVSVTGDLCIDLRGFDITATGRAFHVASGATLSIIDCSGGIVTGSGVAGEQGGVISSAGTLKLYGGKYVYAAGKTVTGGGVVCSAGPLELRNVILDASAYDNTTEEVNGGAILSADGSFAVTLKGARVIGGRTHFGGGAFFGYDNTVSITAASFLNGEALEGGGNLCVRGTTGNAKGTLTMADTAIVDGKAAGSADSAYAGNLYMGRYACTINDCYIAGGSSATYSGNFTVNLGVTATFTNCIIEGGTAGKSGGQVYIPGNSGYLTLDRCLMTNGTAPAGGNINLNNGTCTIKGGEVSHGTATTGNGGNIYAGTDDKTGVTLTADAEGNAPLVCRGTAAGNGGNIFAGDIVNIDAVKFAVGTAPNGGDDLYVNGTGAALVLGSGIIGDVYMNAASSLLTDNVYGGAISNITCEATNANFYLDGTYGNCGTIVKDKTLYVATTAVVDAKGNATWYSSNADAVAACEDGQYVKLFTTNDLVLTKDLYVDLNGNAVNVSGDFTLYGMDASGDDFSVPTGKALGATGATTVTAPNGNTYIAVTESDGVTYHRLDMKIVGVSIRPSSDGMYYSAKWACDDVLKAKIASFGVVASTEDMPDTNFANDEANLWTTFTASQFENGKTQSGAVLTGILKAQDRTTAENEAAAKKPVYAKAYVTFTNGTSLVSGDNIRFSLYDVMKNLDKLIMDKPVQYRKYNLSARNFFEKWKDNGMGNWNLTKIPAPTEDDGVIDVLMVGSSFCYYYVEELYALGQAAGIDIRVSNLYYSGCPLEKHYNWWANGQSNYQYYETFHNGRNLTSNVSLEWGLAQHEWDFISIQQSSSATVKDGAQPHYDKTKQYWEPLINYFLEQFPEAQVLWHQTWTNQVIHGKEGSTVTSIEHQRTNTQIQEEYAKLICDYYNVGQDKTVLQRVPTGRAWMITRENGYDFLCGRLGKTNANTGVAHAGDGYHDGDIGGGQYLNAAVWFEIITGKSVVGNTYIPEYKTTATLADSLLAQVQVVKTETGYALTPELVALLQQAAHEAVATTGFTVR